MKRLVLVALGAALLACATTPPNLPASTPPTAIVASASVCAGRVPFGSEGASVRAVTPNTLTSGSPVEVAVAGFPPVVEVWTLAFFPDTDLGTGKIATSTTDATGHATLQFTMPTMKRTATATLPFCVGIQVSGGRPTAVTFVQYDGQ